MSRELFEEVPFAINFRVYIFNVTNPDEVTAGGKPILQELGPYHFEFVPTQNSFCFHKFNFLYWSN